MQVQKCVSAPNSLQAEPNTKEDITWNRTYHPLLWNLKNSFQIERENDFKSDKALTGKTKDWKNIGNKDQHFSLSAVSNNSVLLAWVNVMDFILHLEVKLYIMLGLKIISSSEGTLRQIPFDRKRAHTKQNLKKIVPESCWYFKREAKNTPIAGSL